MELRLGSGRGVVEGRSWLVDLLATPAGGGPVPRRSHGGSGQSNAAFASPRSLSEDSV